MIDSGLHIEVVRPRSFSHAPKPLAAPSLSVCLAVDECHNATGAWSQAEEKIKAPGISPGPFDLRVERKTRFELATLTLAR